MNLLFAALACARHAPPNDALPVAFPVVLAAPSATGVVADGRYTDGRWSLSVPVPEGWRARAGHGDSALRVALEHIPTKTRVEIWAFQGSSEEPRPRDGCIWTFVDRGHYRTLKVSGVITVATCSPDNPLDPIIFAYVVTRADVVWQLEITAARDEIALGKQLGDELVAGVRW